MAIGCQCGMGMIVAQGEWLMTLGCLCGVGIYSRLCGWWLLSPCMESGWYIYFFHKLFLYIYIYNCVAICSYIIYTYFQSGFVVSSFAFCSPSLLLFQVPRYVVNISINGWVYISSASPFSYIYYSHKWFVALTYRFCLAENPLSIWWVFCSCSGAVSIYTWRGTVPPPDISLEEGLHIGLQSQGVVFPMSDFLVALGVAFGSTLPVNRP